MQGNYKDDKRAILFMDGHITRNNREIMQKFQEAKIDVIKNNDQLNVTNKHIFNCMI